MRYPQLLVRSRNGAELNTERGKVIDFTAGDLFGIAGHPHVRAAAHSAMERFGVSSVSAAERGGYTEIHSAVEELIAKKLLGERAMLFSSRAQAVITLISAGINTKGGPVFIDASVSSPVADACHLAELSSQRVDLSHGLWPASTGASPGLLVIEAVSKHGLHIDNLSKLLEKIAVPLIADESFAFGIAGLLGMGNFPPPILINLPQVRIVSFEASLGVPCCALVGGKSFLEELCSASRQRGSDAGISPSEAAAVGAGFELLDQMAVRRDELGIRSAEMIRALSEQGVTLASSLPLPFITINLPSSKAATEFCGGLLSRGFVLDFLGCLTPFSQSCSVRLVIGSAHSQNHLESVIRSIVEVWKRLPVKK